MSEKISTKSVYNLSAQALDYNLPDERIARYPLEKTRCIKTIGLAKWEYFRCNF